MRLVAGAVVLGTFLGLGHASRVDLLDLSTLLGDRLAVSAAVFLLVGVVSLGGVALQRHRRWSLG